MSWLSHQKGRENLSPKLPSFPQDVPNYKREVQQTTDARSGLVQGARVAGWLGSSLAGTISSPQMSRVVTWKGSQEVMDLAQT